MERVFSVPAAQFLQKMAREELQANEELQPKIEEEIKIALVPKDPEDAIAEEAHTVNLRKACHAVVGELALVCGDVVHA